MRGRKGVPLNMEANGRQVWICCEDFEDPMLQGSDDCFAKLRH
jgi:hypothetical protein